MKQTIIMNEVDEFNNRYTSERVTVQKKNDSAISVIDYRNKVITLNSKGNMYATEAKYNTKEKEYFRKIIKKEN